MMEDHHHEDSRVHHHEIPKYDMEHDLGPHPSEALVEAPSRLDMLDHRKMDMPAFLEHTPYHHQLNMQSHRDQQHNNNNYEQAMMGVPQGKKTKENPKKKQKFNAANGQATEDKKRGRPNIPINEHSNPSVKYRRISDTVDRITNEQDFLKKMINSEWGRKEFFETHALWHAKIISNIAYSLKSLPNNSPLRKQIIHLIGDDIPAAVLSRLLDVSEKTIYRSRKLDPHRGQSGSLSKVEKEKKNKDQLLLELQEEEPVNIQSVVVNHGQVDSDGNDESNSNVHDIMRQNLNNNGLPTYPFINGRIMELGHQGL